MTTLRRRAFYGLLNQRPGVAESTPSPLSFTFGVAVGALLATLAMAAVLWFPVLR
jgi:hypothetical protein